MSQIAISNTGRGGRRKPPWVFTEHDEQIRAIAEVLNRLMANPERPAIFAGYLIRVLTGPELDAEFLNLSLNAPAFKDYCMEVKTDGVSQSNINARKLADYAVDWCPVAEQHEIVRRVGALFALADKIESRVALATQRIEKTTQAILAKAFRGELVPTEAELARQQNRDYEPATALLERIRAERKILEGKRVANKVARPKRRKVSDGKQRRRNAK